MATITKLGQTFVQKTEATAASQNAQNAKIDELIDIFGKETSGNTKTIALPLIKDSTTYKVTNIGTGLSVQNNTLNATTYTLPKASASSLGGIKIGTGLSIDNDGVVSATGGTGGVTQDQVNTSIDNKIGNLDKTDSAVNGKYVSAVSQTDGIVSITRADLPSLVSSDLKYFTKATANNYSILGASVQTTTFVNSVASFNITNSHKTLVLLLPTDKSSFTLRDSSSQDITGDLIPAGAIMYSNKLYNTFYFSGSTVADNYTLTKNS